MTESTPDKSAESASSPPASAPDELLKDLHVEVSEAEQDFVSGGTKEATITHRKAGKVQQEF